MWIVWALACGIEGEDSRVAPVDSAPPADSGGPAGSGGGEDSAALGDTADTGELAPCEEVLFTPSEGAPVDYTAALTEGEAVTLEEDGTLTFCPGSWFVQLVVEASVSVVGLGAGPEETVLSGGEQGSVIVVSGPVALDLEAVTLDRGAALGSWNNERGGGGLRCASEASVVLRDVVMSNNTAYDGAALYAGEGCHVDAEGLVMRDNLSEDDAGAARFDEASGDLRELTVSGNSARDAGGLLLHESELTISDAVFAGNVSTDSQGGGVLHYFGTLSIEDSSFLENRVNAQGGGLSLFGETSLSEVAFVGNSAHEGGGIYHYAGYGELTCSGCTFSKNIPDDVRSDASGSFEVPEDGDFTCDTSGCSTGSGR